MTTPDAFTGFDQARHALWCYEARSQVHRKLIDLPLLADDRVHLVHIDNVSRMDRIRLLAFDLDGNELATDTVYNDDGKELDPVAQFQVRNHPSWSDPSRDGWMLDVDKLHRYDLVADRRDTQKAMVLALLPDLINSGDARCMLFSDDMFANPDMSGLETKRDHLW